MKHPLSRLLLVLLLALQLLSPPATGRADASACRSTDWPHQGSDLAPDPALIFGRLDNGLRYVLQANKEPKNRVALYLNVQAGSLNETEEQRGLAHFLEHMLFNGTRHYPPGTLVEYFQSIGMGFGGDTNAHTGYDETVYNLLLPGNDPKVVEEGLRVLADYARGALLLPAEVDKERGIILSEKRSRDSAAARVAKEQLKFEFAGSLVASRDPIGLEEVIKGADSARLRAYYDRWYRPDNMIVVMVGDMDTKTVEPLLKSAFEHLAAAGEAGPCPDYGRVEESGLEVLFFPEQELGTTSLSLSTTYNVESRTHTRDWEAEQLRRYLAMTMLENRLRSLEQRPGSHLAQPRAQAGFFVRRFGYAILTARTDADQWRHGLATLQTTLAQALKDGFGEAELVRAKKQVAALLEKAVQTAATRDSRELAETIIRKLNDDEVVQSPAQETELYAPMLEKMELAEVNGALRRLWDRPRRLVEVAGATPPELTPDKGGELIRAAWQAREKEPLSPWVEERPVAFPYLPSPDGGLTVVSQEEHAAIGVTTTVLDGGVRLNCKRTDFQANQILLSVQFGGGRNAEPAPGLAQLAEAVSRESGIGQLSRVQLAEALAGTNVQLEFRVGPESFSLTGSSLQGEFERLLQLLYHRLHDPAFTADDFRRGKENLRRMYDQQAGTVEGVQQREGQAYLTGGSREYTLATWEEIDRISREQLQTWLAPILAREPLEINVVGDIDPREALRLVGRYFGHERRSVEPPRSQAAIVFPAGNRKVIPVASSIDKAALTLAWKTNDFWDIGRTRRLNLLAAVFDDRLRVRIREELGATYSPRVISRPSRVNAGFGLFEASMVVAPEQARSLDGAIREVARSLVEKGVSEEELRRALEPTLTSIRDLKRSNRYWLEVVLNLSSRHPQQLVWPLSIIEGFSAIKAGELTELARDYLSPDQAATVIVTPRPEDGGQAPVR